MNFKHPFINLLAGLIMMLMLMITINFVQSRDNQAMANQEFQQPVPGDIQYQEDDDEDEDEQEEEWEEEERDDYRDRDWEEERHEEERYHELREFETNMARLEIIGRLAEVAENPTMTASYALMQLERFAEDDEEAADVLSELIESDRVSPPVRNLLKMKLVEVLADERDEAIEVLMSMVTEDGGPFHVDHEHDEDDDHEHDDDHDQDDDDDDEALER